MSTSKPRQPSEHKPNPNTPYCAFTDEQLLLEALRHLEVQRTIRRVAMTLGSVFSAAATVCVYLLKSGLLATT